ncbi:DUF2695 domain-containing protein [Pedobacter sp. UBA5917]|jgi:hypothetical protein|uniref:DUF2695 domain-containing protein n=1 Tax=Pedobacter sp. UBA5917 TaxID=1947061 RepID=UPI0025F515D9|nr:DUF2695 domain-containing protein [Pedobacter sp. UBA5917]
MADKDMRKQIRNELRLKAQKEFEESLPMTIDKFKSLFDYLDLALQKEKCNDDHCLTIRFLNLIAIDNIDDVISWLLDNNGFCDCETLVNVEEHFE